MEGRQCEVLPRFSGGTWVRVRGLQLTTSSIYLDSMLSEYGDIVVNSSHSTWKNTKIKTGDRTLKMKLRKDIPAKLKAGAFGWITLRYRDQPELCFSCGKPGHQQWACEEREETSHAAVVQLVAPAPTPTPVARSDRAPPSSPELDSSKDDDAERKKKKEKKERKDKERYNTGERRNVGKHEGLPAMIPTMKHADKRRVFFLLPNL